MSYSALGQSYFREHFGGSVGLILSTGTHTNAIGINFHGFYTDHVYQLNIGSSFKLFQNDLGDRRKFWSNRNSIGIVLLGGKRERQIDFELDALNHQTDFNTGIGFNYIFYVDNAGTSQQSGGFSAHLKNVSIYHENDMFAGNAKDRFRTGHFRFSYLWDNFKFDTGVQLWTGETSGSYWQHISFNGCPSGFKLLENNPYGKTSHGNLYAGLKYNLPYFQTVEMHIGIDSEHVRHVIQNRIIHDAGSLIHKGTPHYPRLDTNGCATFEKENTRKNRLYFQFGTNENWAY